MSHATTLQTEASSILLPKQKNSTRGIFNYWSTPDLPEISEITAVFSGQSSKLRSVETTINDIRSTGLNAFNLSENGFQVLQHSSSLLPPQSASIPDFHNENLMRTKYWPEIISLLRTQLGVRAAVAINTTVRDVVDASELKADNPRANPRQSFNPFFVVHGDYTPAGARGHMRALLRSFFGENGSLEGTSEGEREAFFGLRDEIIKAENEGMEREGVMDAWEWSGRNYEGPRWGMLSVWRPLEMVERDPLAVMDGRSLCKKGGDEGYVPFARVYKDRPGFEREFRTENMLPVAPLEGKEGCRWYYVSRQRPEQVLALKLFDSEAHREGSGVVECAPHSAFQLPGQEEQRLRRSAEVRVMVVW